ncbi:MAG: ABC transporter permease [Nitrospirae bacterium]|nr:ABC transporter permease [Nitrospirota bacterium]
MFSVKMALQSILREKWINFLTMATLGVLLFIFFAILLVLYNVERLTSKIPSKLSSLVVLKDDASKEEIAAVESEAKRSKLVKTVDFISKEAAMEDLKKVFKSDDFILKGFGENPLFNSFEIKFKSDEDVKTSDIKALISKLKTHRAVDDVEFGQAQMESLSALKHGVRTIGVTLSTTFACAVVFISYTTVKILFYRRKEEIEIYKLLGATRGFIRLPFFLEGAIVGFCGGLSGAVMLQVLNKITLSKLTAEIPLFAVVNIPFTVFLLFPVIGLMLGLGGAVLAVGRVRY